VQDDFKWSPLSIHYVETELQKLNDMNDFKAGVRELEYAAELNAFKQQTRIEQEKGNSTNLVAQMRYQTRKRMIDLLAVNN